MTKFFDDFFSYFFGFFPKKRKWQMEIILNLIFLSLKMMRLSLNFKASINDEDKFWCFLDNERNTKERKIGLDNINFSSLLTKFSCVCDNLFVTKNDNYGKLFDFNFFSTLILTTKKRRNREWNSCKHQDDKEWLKSKEKIMFHLSLEITKERGNINEHLNYTSDTLSVHLRELLRKGEKFHKQKKHY